MLEKVARTEFAFGSFDLVTLIYILLGKSKAASIIWKKSSNAEAGRLSEFLLLNFETAENRLKAEKNAFSLLGKQRFSKIAIRFTILLTCIL